MHCPGPITVGPRVGTAHLHRANLERVSMGTHSKPRDRRMSATKIAGLGGIAAAAATMAMSVGAGTAEAAPTPGAGSGAHGAPGAPGQGAPGAPGRGAPGSAATSSTIGSLGGLYNPGPIALGTVTKPTLKAPQQYLGQFIVTPAVPGSRPFASVQGFQLPFWTINPSTGAPVPPF
jgi:hypothetical protein